MPLSPFFHPPPTANPQSLAILHLKRDSLMPVKLADNADDGYAEGAVTNTRFGSFPHSTLIGLEWGSQVRASKVDTGTRGRRGKKAKQEESARLPPQQAEHDGAMPEETSTRKRKLLDDPPPAEQPSTSPLKKSRPNHALENGEQQQQQQQQPPSSRPGRVPIDAGSGFVHLLPPTPESWTSSLDHRTQVVYTPDYSYILQRLRVRPGDHIIEAGAGSGSFTHAAARAVFSGYPTPSPSPSQAKGKVFSFEYHEPRVRTLQQELIDHALDGIVELTHRDVCNEGFVLSDGTAKPSVNAVFLDLPAPWLALKHLSRSTPHSPLNPHAPIHMCTFSPCIEQVMATVAALRKAGWADIEMVEVQHKRIDVRRERVGFKEEGLRGVNACAASVDEAVGRLREVEHKLSAFHHPSQTANVPGMNRAELAQEKKAGSKAERLLQIKKAAEDRKLYKEGNLVTRSEPEVKTHTSYLVFAVLPREWSDADEQELLLRFPVEMT